METILCGASAFQFHRIPPIVLTIIEDAPDLSTRSGRRRLKHLDAFLDYIDLPLEVLVTDRARRADLSMMKTRYFCRELPMGSIKEIDAYHAVTSPALTLLTMASDLNEIQLAMATYELCGRFSVCRLRPEHKMALAQVKQQWGSMEYGGWSPVLDFRGNITDLWKRPPLVTLDELYRSAQEYQGCHGVKGLRRALEWVRGCCASPFEVQAVMRLCGSRRKGGEGFGPVMLNSRMEFHAAAREASSLSHCYIDIFFPGNEHHGPYAIECQGRVVHGESGITSFDANRLLGLQQMGVKATLVTSEQLYDQSRYEHLARLVARELAAPYREKTELMKRAEGDLCRNLFIDWTTLGR